MLDLRPNCECCDKDLPPTSLEAYICTYECTFCADCVESILHNVCPNCGGGFMPRPVRPSKEHRSGLSIHHQPPSQTRVKTKYTPEELSEFCDVLKEVNPESR